MADKTTKASKKAVKATEVKTVAQLNDDLTKLLAENLESRRSHRLGELVNPHVLTVQRKNIARLHTAIAAANKAELSTEKEEK
ncbi:MAG: 50S ribosomal protein L29 [Candidatus Microsaccharimonas sp.]